jgi:hypothetical protein
MKKYQAFMLLAALCATFVMVYPNPQVQAIEGVTLTPEQDQDQAMLLDVDILGMCISETAVKEIRYGFSTEHIITFAFGECEHEVNSLIASLKNIDVPNKDIIIIMNALHKQSVKGLRKMRDTVAREMKRRASNPM